MLARGPGWDAMGEATFRHERRVAGKEDGPGAGRPGAQAEGGVRRGHGGMPSVMNALLEACAYRDARHGGQSRARRPCRPGKPPFALAGQSGRGHGTPESVAHKFG